jgi:hypothetical protein
MVNLEKREQMYFAEVDKGERDVRGAVKQASDLRARWEERERQLKT